MGSDEYALSWLSSEGDCERGCLDDCNCVVALYKDQYCRELKLPLRYGKRTASQSIRAFIKSRIGSSSRDTHSKTIVVNKIITNRLGKEFLIVGLVLMALSLITFVSCGFLIYRNRIWSYQVISKNANLQSDFVEEINLKSFTYNELAQATNNFKEELGRGAFGRVYKGSLPRGRREIAVKKLERVAEEGETEFQTEMKVIGRTHHRNLVQLLGFCSEDLLFKAQMLPEWKERVRISIEIARGILYLHEECQTHIIHCDLKPHNILMDDVWTAKISDFGLAKLLMPDQTRTFTTPRGTRGYQAPESHKNEPVTVKADVYSFGTLLLEIICCRRKLELSVAEEEIILLE
ncbi:PREDICTED: G-type lectin S-receptor-like serine/threonine-protein kinase RLK1 [Nelumbo nucifera]|uniref:non-specific serine/threonine protein kinase n=2 Tax=Nelumbo nucifera TaxID=4432 RepID=A0A1U7Z4R8_NELNU|nr:PREDICTED: G-type lectin S-receptor-like serine/threonine-protein kinase RLK1 [Nelumbo nucifera]DAD40007.1 TPA_asm: hypothetical protein HUJ06_014330 [Nelumbo nucifera]